jgi:putative membrane protein
MFIPKLLSSACGAVFLLLLACSGPSAETETEAPQIIVIRTLQDDPAFWDYAASSSMLQVGAGKLAMEKGSTAQVKA